MPRIPTVAITLLVLCTMATPCLAQRPEPTDSVPTGEIEGVLGSHWGLGPVRLSRPDGREETAEADRTGRFLFRGLAPGVYWVLTDGFDPRRVELTKQSGAVSVTDSYLARTPRMPADTLATLADRVKRGRSVTVTLDTGEELRGRLDSVSAAQLAVRSGRTTRVIDEASIWRIESRKRGYLWKGAAAGAAGLGAGVVYLLAGVDENSSGSVSGRAYLKTFGIASGIGAVLGVSVAAFETGSFGSRELLFQRRRGTTLTPIVSRRAVGAALSLGWH